MNNIQRKRFFRKNHFNKDIDRLDEECAIDFNQEVTLRKTTGNSFGKMGNSFYYDFLKQSIAIMSKRC